MSEDATQGDQRSEVLRLCAAVRQAMDHLALERSSSTDLNQRLSAAEKATLAKSADADVLVDSVKAIRYVLVEAADGPIAAILADSAARIVGDGIGGLFS